jgi:hypothetical protein
MSIVRENTFPSFPAFTRFRRGKQSSPQRGEEGEGRDTEVPPTFGSRFRFVAVFCGILLVVGQALAAESPSLTVTCALPDDHLIWPVPTGAASVIVEAKFGSMQELLRIRRGNHFEITTRVVYKISGAKSEFPHDEISFIVRDYRATPESGIMEKRVGNPFGPGTARFWLDKPEHGGVWGIQSYEVNRTLD